jgi:hypothetical protein
MRSIGRLTTGLALATLLPAAAGAQERPFTDSWFWGVKGGAMTVKTPYESKLAPTAGAEWFITRTRAGLYVSVEQGYFDGARGLVADSSIAGGTRAVALENFRRASFALLGFPHQWGSVRPYVGIGLALNMVQSARPNGTYSSETAKQTVMQSIEDRRTRTAAVLMGGVQGSVRGVGVFGQATAMPTGSQFFLSGAATTYMLEAGLRFNVGSAIERLDR